MKRGLHRRSGVRGPLVNIQEEPARHRSPFPFAPFLFLLVLIALCVWSPYHRDRRAAAKIVSMGGEVEWTATPLNDRFDIPFSQRAVQVFVTNAPLTDRAMDALLDLRYLETLYVRSLDDAQLRALTSLNRLKDLRVDKSNVTDSGLRSIRWFSRLESLRLAGGRITDAGVQHLGGLTRLESLDLSDTQIGDNALKHLRSLQNLRWLDLDGTNVTDEGLRHLQPLTALEDLSLSRTRITDDGLRFLAGLSLWDLQVAGTAVTSEGRNDYREQRSRQRHLFGFLKPADE